MTRISASGAKKSTPKTAVATSAAAPKKKQAKKPAAKTTAPAPVLTDKKRNVFQALGDYFAGAWYELTQVSWPTRRATWSLTGALIVFTGFFVALILLLDSLFKYLFELLLG